MHRLSKEFRAPYTKALQLFSDSPPFEKSDLSYEDVLLSHFLVADYFRKSGDDKILYGVKSSTLLGSAISRQHTEWEGKKKWKDPLEICATLFFGLVKNHAFHDGNKRTALLCLLYHLHKICRTPVSAQKEFENFTVAIARGDYKRLVHHSKPVSDDEKIIAITKWLRANTRKTDKRFYALSYRELGEKLKLYGYYLGNEDRGFIDVLQDTPTRYVGLINGKPKTRRVIQIGFFGWHRQVNMKAAMSILKSCQLDEKHGVDSHVFFQGGDPLYKLMDDFHGPLLRLKDK